MPQSPSRFIGLDLFKTALVWGMIGAHVVQLTSLGLPRGAARYSDFINLVSFSGFMFAFGVGLGLPKPVRARSMLSRLWPALVMLLSVYVSSIGFTVLVERKALAGPLVYDLFSLSVLFGYSEFLTSFLVLYLLIAFARPVLVWIGGTPRALIAVSIVCLAATPVTVGVNLPLAGAIFGSTNYASFPLVPYLPWFLLGIHFGADGRKPDRLDYLAALATSAPLAWFVWRTGLMPQRFPPSVMWIAGPAAALMVYWGLARLIGRIWPLGGLWLLAPGRHVLAALVVSNLAIFSIRRLMFKPVHSVTALVLTTGAILVLVTVVGLIMDALERRRGGGEGRRARA